MSGAGSAFVVALLMEITQNGVRRGPVPNPFLRCAPHPCAPLKTWPRLLILGDPCSARSRANTRLPSDHKGVHTSVNAARMRARATVRLHRLWWTSRPMGTSCRPRHPGFRYVATCFPFFKSCTPVRIPSDISACFRYNKRHQFPLPASIHELPSPHCSDCGLKCISRSSRTGPRD